ncbi:MAG: deoxyribose-phosphate aldolase [Erysipelotrichaceae bacterium]|nr:deoxyribose-phosphate aldolase [Erysipelotrichaceae bacterium]
MDINKFFDHTLLAADASYEAIQSLCDEAKQYRFMSVCVNPYYVPVAKKLLAGSDVKVCTVIGFPLGQMTPAAKVFEAADAIKMGADEVDMVLNIPALKRGDLTFVTQEIHAVKEAVGNHVLKVILECCYLSDEEKVKGCLCAKKAGADFVKTSTGFGKSGATEHDVALMRKTVGTSMGVKAAGGIHTYQDVEDMIRAGANRIGCSHSVAIMKEQKKA